MRILTNKLLISFKKSFVDVNTTHDSFHVIPNEKFKRKHFVNEKKSTSFSHDSNISKRSYYSVSGNKRYSSIHLSPKFEYGHNRPPNTAYTSSTGKRQTFYSNPSTQIKITDQNLSDIEKNYSVNERRSATLESGFGQRQQLGNPTMYKSKPRLQVSFKPK